MIPLELCYPRFKDGQVLTHTDLNLLREFLLARYRFHNSVLTGFGVGCGLDGAVTDGQVSISAGFALAQGGVELVATEARTWTVPQIQADAAAREGCDFLDQGPGGFTALLRLVEHVEPEEDCTEGDCEEHADRVCQDVDIVWAPGRLEPQGVFEHDAFGLSPLRSQSDFTIPGFDTRVDELADMIEPLVGPETSDLLREMELTEEPGINLMKMGVVNEVLYALWAYLRCQGRMQADCFGVTGQPCVALGWLSRVGATWTWHCAYRHHFVLSPALYLAMQGYRCGDLCARHADRIRELLQSFEVPVIPEEDEEPEETPEGDPVICPRGWWYDPALERCVPPEEPPVWWEELPVWEIPWDIGGGIVDGGVWGGGDIDPVPWMREQILTDPVGAGTVILTDTYGKAGQTTATWLKEGVLEKTGRDASVTVLPVSEMSENPDIVIVERASLADEIYLGVNEGGAVVATGVIPAGAAMQDVGASFSQVKATAAQADEVAGEALAEAQNALGEGQRIDEELGALTQQFQTFSADMPPVGDVKDAVEFATGWEGTSSALRASILGEMHVELGKFKGEMQVELGEFKEGILEGQGELVQTLMGDVAELKEEVFADFGTFKGEVQGQLGEMQTLLPMEQLATGGILTMDDLDAFRSELTVRMDAMQRDVTRRIDERFDTREIADRAGLQYGGEQAREVNLAIMKQVESMQKAVLEATPEESKPAVEAEFKKVEGEMEKLRSSSRLGISITETNPEEFSAVMHNFTAAAELGLGEGTTAAEEMARSAAELDALLAREPIR